MPVIALNKCKFLVAVSILSIIAWSMIATCRVKQDRGFGANKLAGSTWTPPIDETFEACPDTTLATAVPLFSAGPGHDVDASIVAQVALDGSDHVLNLTDKDIDKDYEIIKSLRHDYLVGENLSFDIKPFTATSSTCSFEIICSDGGTNITRLKIFQDNASIGYFDTAWHSSGVSVTLDAWQIFYIEFTSTSTFKLRIATGSWSSALSNENSISAAVDGIEFVSPTSNGGAPVNSYIVDDFESPWAVSDTLVGSKRSGTWANTGSNTHAIISGQYGHIVTDAGYGDDKVVFQDSGSIAASDYIEWKINPTETTKTMYLRIANDASETHGIVMMLASDGQVYIWSGGVSSAITTYSTGWHTMRVIFNSQTSWSLEFDATTYGPYSPNDGAMDHVYSVDYMSGANTGTFDLDDIITSWAQSSTPGSVASLKTYLDDIGIDMASRFTSNATSIIGGQSVSFTFTGITGNGAMGYQWSFGDGTANATTQNSVHKYTTAGTMDVILTITDVDSDINVKRELGFITVAADLFPDADFISNATSIVEGESINFTHSASNGNVPATYQWDFGDLTANATIENVTHVYTAAGTYTVVLTIQDVDGDVDVERKVNYINVAADILPNASFTANATSIFAGQSIAFTHAGSNGNAPASYQWDFGDLTANATIENPVHAYTTAGTYTVILTVIDVDGDQDTCTRTNHITVAAADLTPPSTSLSFTPAFAPDFVNTSTSFTFTAVDNPGGSGVASTWFKCTGVFTRAWGLYIFAFTLSTATNGTVMIEYCSIDNMGNNETLQAASVRIDTIGPSVAISFAPVHTSGSKRWVNGSTTFALAASDNPGGSGIAAASYKINAGAWTLYSGAFTLGSLTNGSYTIYYTAVDNVGNVSVMASITTFIDTIAPATSFSYDSSLVTVTLAALDATGGSGIGSTWYAIGNGSWSLYSAAFVPATSSGTYIIYYYSIDNAGNNETVLSITLVITIALPVPVVTFDLWWLVYVAIAVIAVASIAIVITKQRKSGKPRHARRERRRREPRQPRMHRRSGFALKMIETSISVAITIAVLYPIVDALAVDSVHVMVEKGYNSGQVQGLTTINYVLWISRLVLMAIFVDVHGTVFRGQRGATTVLGCTVIIVLLGMPQIIASIAGLSGIQGFQPNTALVPVLPAMIATFVYGDIGTYVLLDGVLLVVISAGLGMVVGLRGS